MANETRVSLETLNLSAKQIKIGTNWPDFMVNDYLTTFRNSVIIANTTDSNITLIEKNTLDIQTNANNLTAHEDLTSAHGVTGNNVGTEDFATSLIGGVSLLMDLVNDAVNSTQTIVLADIAEAPAAYNQAYTQTLADMSNDTKAKHNQLVIDLNSVANQLNDLIAKSKAAKQMSV